ncbi:flagellar basal body rod protein FlgC [Lacisediminimonas sp.]|uniref:flagellar basal body rod protein FlgC n=1 Tax=Lacisediminimonas sp. TaxID=3060582 RepID=UPI0027208F0B|nr:flagellar basal body rod protein FlgC [Lacisediminimonas sp.]MDO8299543.1 flagellar basal body rod protein FlgC [Lacisediminimonas sp.]MDO9217644.1 flagellar basal body rod protein FlgC [Lacisediminimonas sp.]
MNYLAAFEISAAGMSFERLRVNVAAANIANAHTTRTASGGPYRPLQALAASAPGPSAFESQMTLAAHTSALRKPVVVESVLAPRLVHEPGHPDANERGFVAYPNINPVTEMVGLMTATRAYEANVAALNATRSMAQKALEIGGR